MNWPPLIFSQDTNFFNEDVPTILAFAFYAVTARSVADPGCLSRIPDPDFYLSWIQCWAAILKNVSFKAIQIHNF